LFSRFLGISSTLKVTTNIKMIEVFMLVGLMLTFSDVLMQSYLHHKEYQGPKGDLRLLDKDVEEEDSEDVKELLLFLARHGYLRSDIKDQSSSGNKTIINSSSHAKYMPAIINMEQQDMVADLYTSNKDHSYVPYGGEKDSGTTSFPEEKDGGATSAPVDTQRKRKEAIFDLAMSQETVEQPDVAVVQPNMAMALQGCWDDKKVQGEDNK
jgi:hypothetical protein